MEEGAAVGTPQVKRCSRFSRSEPWCGSAGRDRGTCAPCGIWPDSDPRQGRSQQRDLRSKNKLKWSAVGTRIFGLTICHAVFGWPVKSYPGGGVEEVETAQTLMLKRCQGAEPPEQPRGWILWCRGFCRSGIGAGGWWGRCWDSRCGTRLFCRGVWRCGRICRIYRRAEWEAALGGHLCHCWFVFHLDAFLLEQIHNHVEDC